MTSDITAPRGAIIAPHGNHPTGQPTRSLCRFTEIQMWVRPREARGLTSHPVLNTPLLERESRELRGGAKKARVLEGAEPA